MATISKFYLHNATSSVVGTLPGAGDAFVSQGGSGDSTGDTAGARTSRVANDTIGTLETSSVTTFTANTNPQAWGHRRFVSDPLAAHTFALADGNWVFSFAGVESNTNHNGVIFCTVYAWRPGTGARVGTHGSGPNAGLSLGGTTKTAYTTSGSNPWSGTDSILDGDILVFEISDATTQGMGTAYTSTFYYDGTTEASTTSCASFVTSPVALTLFTGAAAEVIPDLVMARR